MPVWQRKEVQAVPSVRAVHDGAAVSGLRRALAERIYDAVKNASDEYMLFAIEQCITEEATKRRQVGSVGGMIVDSLSTLFPDDRFCLARNEHETSQDLSACEWGGEPHQWTLLEWLTCRIDILNPEWATPTSRERAVQTSTLWRMEWGNDGRGWYAHRVYGATLEEVLRAAIPVENTPETHTILGRPFVMSAMETVYGVRDIAPVGFADFSSMMVPLRDLPAEERTGKIVRMLSGSARCALCFFTPRIGEIGPCPACNDTRQVDFKEEWPLTDEAKARLTEKIGAELVLHIIEEGTRQQPSAYSNKTEAAAR